MSVLFHSKQRLKNIKHNSIEHAEKMWNFKDIPNAS